MKRVKAKPIKELIPTFLREEGLETPLLEFKITHQGWNDTAGEAISKHTKNIHISNQTLYIECDSAVVRQEITLRKSDLIYNLNKYVDAYVINNIVVK